MNTKTTSSDHVHAQTLPAIGPASVVTVHQTRTYGPVPMKTAAGAPVLDSYGVPVLITAVVRFDDRCGNGYNTFSITANTTTGDGGCMHDDVARHFPELAPLIKWHLTSTNGPLHYIENTMYWLGRRGYTRWDNERKGRPSSESDPPNIAHARKCAVWPDMPEGYVSTGTFVSNVTVEDALAERLPALLAEFRSDVESLGFTW